MIPRHDDPSSLVTSFLVAFNSGDADALDRLYEPDGVLVPRVAAPVSGPARIAASSHLLSFGLPMRAAVRHAYVTGDLALLIVDWRLSGTSSGGHAVDLSGTATDVVRRGPDGVWRYAIDNPMGTAIEIATGSGRGTAVDHAAPAERRTE